MTATSAACSAPQRADRRAGPPVLRGAIYDPAPFASSTTDVGPGTFSPTTASPCRAFSDVSKRLIAMAQNGYLPTVSSGSGLAALQNNSYAPSNAIPITNDRFVSVKLDQIISNNHKLSGVWTIDDQGRTLANNGGIFDASAGVLGGPLGGSHLEKVRGQNARISHDWTISPRDAESPYAVLDPQRPSRADRAARNRRRAGCSAYRISIPSAFPRSTGGSARS